MTMRLRRLQAEYTRLQTLFAEHAQIQIVDATGTPPDRYVIEYRVRGLVEEGGAITERDVHRAQITLGPNYPREIPRCVMLTPVFHPNIDHLAICTEDIRATSQTLDQTIVFIGAMLTFQAYNLQSPRNGDAARWTAEHRDELPLENTDLMPHQLMTGGEAMAPAFSVAEALTSSAPTAENSDAPSSEAVPLPRQSALQVCANCHQPPTDSALHACANAHLVCASCQVGCPNCQQRLCVLCPVAACKSCGELFCEACVIPCDGCRAMTCLSHIRRCQHCQKWLCSTLECSQFCDVCGRLGCVSHLNETGRCAVCSAIQAADSAHEKATLERPQVT